MLRDLQGKAGTHLLLKHMCTFGCRDSRVKLRLIRKSKADTATRLLKHVEVVPGDTTAASRLKVSLLHCTQHVDVTICMSALVLSLKNFGDFQNLCKLWGA